jgi:hypothetical protein
VWRGGYQISYDPLFTQALSSLLAASSPNSISTVINAPGSGRGFPDFYERLPTAPTAPSLMDSQRGALEKNFRNSYTERWSFGFQRQLSSKLVLDGSYIGSESHRLATLADINFRLPNGLQRLCPDFGQRQIRASEGNSSYHAMQWRVDRRFARGFQANASYTWSRNIDSTSEGIGTINWQEPTSMNVTSIPEALGGMKLDRGPSDYDRTHRFTAAYIWNVPGPAARFWKAFGGWSISGITSFQSGAPFTVANDFDRNNDGILQDRPDIGNPNAPLNSRAVVTPASASQFCSTGYRNPDTGLCVSPSDVHWIEGAGLPNAATVGRNTLNTGGIVNFDLDLTKSLPIGEGRRLEFRWEALNALNHPQFTSIPAFKVVGAPPGRFLNKDVTDSGIRTMWAQVKVVF